MIETVAFLAVILVVRVATLILVGHFVHGREISDDSGLQLVLARDPFGRLTNTGAPYGQYPPFFGALLAPTVALFSPVVSDFYVIRITAITWELLTAALYAVSLHRLGAGARTRRWCYLAWLTVPMTWMTSTVMGQKDFVPAFFFAATLLLAWRRSWVLAALAASVGVVAAKIFLLLPLVVLVFLCPPGRRREVLAAGAAPIVAVYAYLVILGAVQGHGLALLHFHPNAPFGTQGWTLLTLHVSLSNALESRLSEVLAVLGVAAVLGWWVRTGRPDAGGVTPADPTALALMMASAVLAVFSLFYHVNDSYFTMLVPALLLPAFAGRRRVLLAVATVAPWAVNFFYGVQTAIAEHTVGGKGAFVKLYHHFTHGSPRPYLELALALTAVSWAVLAVVSVRDARRLSQEHMARTRAPARV
ncbi:hypothetical protein K6U06_22390 [Acidiferrimicrobium sp. IK]|uniref:glycosyltransferase 87 family protein n=1 Tax=Acidiferrimicrobium sp. IK TaxID=2871700 RepID=UPI0021CB6ECA|nr:glycosyltransferase 87 family protein [Acidiferrimicrobium sp. IK]MCU4187128.1 hypothetical protein [Acidiferrimicrobium sp. IK]